MDGALSSIRVLPEIVEAVGDQIEVHLDSGIRSGQDVLKAIAMGAKGTYIGARLHLWSGARGVRRGVREALEVIHRELDVSMALCGRKNIVDVDRDILLVDDDFHRFRRNI